MPKIFKNFFLFLRFFFIKTELLFWNFIDPSVFCENKTRRPRYLLNKAKLHCIFSLEFMPDYRIEILEIKISFGISSSGFFIETKPTL